jgi:pantoate kinase
MEAAISKGVITINSAEVKKVSKTDTEQLIQVCNSFANRTGLTHEEIQSTLESVRKRLNACGR